MTLAELERRLRNEGVYDVSAVIADGVWLVRVFGPDNSGFGFQAISTGSLEKALLSALDGLRKKKNC